MSDYMNSNDSGQDAAYVYDPESSIDLNISVLTDRDGSATSLTDKSGIHIFDRGAEARIQHYVQSEQEKLLFYKEEVFEGEMAQTDDELKAIKEQVFAITTPPNRSVDHKNTGLSDKSNIIWFIILPIICIYISLSYGRFKKKEREKRIADIDDCYDE